MDVFSPAGSPASSGRGTIFDFERSDRPRGGEARSPAEVREYSPASLAQDRIAPLERLDSARSMSPPTSRLEREIRTRAMRAARARQIERQASKLVDNPGSLTSGSMLTRYMEELQRQRSAGSSERSSAEPAAAERPRTPESQTQSTSTSTTRPVSIVRRTSTPIDIPASPGSSGVGRSQLR